MITVLICCSKVYSRLKYHEVAIIIRVLMHVRKAKSCKTRQGLCSIGRYSCWLFLLYWLLGIGFQLCDPEQYSAPNSTSKELSGHHKRQLLDSHNLGRHCEIFVRVPNWEHQRLFATLRTLLISSLRRLSGTCPIERERGANIDVQMCHECLQFLIHGDTDSCQSRWDPSPLPQLQLADDQLELERT